MTQEQIGGKIEDMSAEEMYSNLFNLDFMTEEERKTIFTATEMYAKGKTRFLQAEIKTLTEYIQNIKHEMDKRT